RRREWRLWLPLSRSLRIVIPSEASDLQSIASKSRARAPGATGYHIQFVPASRFPFVVIFFACLPNSIDPRPVMSQPPNFDSFHPPNENGLRGTGTPPFTPTIPALACSIT